MQEVQEVVASAQFTQGLRQAEQVVSEVEVVVDPSGQVAATWHWLIELSTCPEGHAMQ